MKQGAQALYSFFSSFGIPAYVEYTEPDGANPPYITYELIDPDWRGKAQLHARVWYRDTSFIALAETVDRIRAALGEGVSIKTPSGAVYLWAADAWAQIQPMEGDRTLRCAYLSMIYEAHSE